MAKIDFLPELVKSKDHLETVLLPVDALEFFEALSFAQSCIYPDDLNAPQVPDHLERLRQLQSFFALYYADYLESRLKAKRKEVVNSVEV